MKLCAKGVGFDAYSITFFSELSINELTSLLKLKPVQAKVLEIDGPLCADENENMKGAIAELNDIMVELNNKLVKIKHERVKILGLFTEARYVKTTLFRVMNKQNPEILPQKSGSFLGSIAFGRRPICSV